MTRPTLSLSRPLRSDRFNRYDYDTALCHAVYRRQRRNRYIKRFNLNPMQMMVDLFGHTVWVSMKG